MVVGIKDAFKLVGISIVACCAVFVCTLFLSCNMDLARVDHSLLPPAGLAMYQALVSMGKVTSAVTGGCLLVTSVIMLLFYVKNYIDSHGKALGILKALGYSNFKVASCFWVFGISVFAGCALGYGLATAYMPTFYQMQNADGLFSGFAVSFHPQLVLWLIGAPTLFFVLISVGCAYAKLCLPVLDLLRESPKSKCKIPKDDESLPFLQDLKKSTLRSKKTLVFFVAFSAFCFSAMTQMSMSMNQLASDSFAFMIITIGLVLAFVTLILSLSSVVRANVKTIGMMKVLGYDHSSCSKAVLGGYRPFSYIGFIIGTAYQYGLLKLVLLFVFTDVQSVPEYTFNFEALGVTLIAFVAVYEMMMYLYAQRIKRLSIKAVMLD